MSYVCPRCGTEGHNPHDAREGYCGACHDWTITDQMDESTSKAWHAGLVAGFNAAQGLMPGPKRVLDAGRGDATG